MKNRLYIIHTEQLRKEIGGDTVMQYDIFKIIAAVQGLVNRYDPELYLMWQDADSFWLDYMQEEGKFFHGGERVTLRSFLDFIEVYGGFIREHGLAVWDENVPAAMNAVTAACGIDGYIPVRCSIINTGRGSANTQISKTGESTAGWRRNGI